MTKLDDLIARARADEPTPEQLASLTKRLGPLLGPGAGGGGGGGGGGGAGGGATAGAAAKIAIATGGLGAIAVVVGIAVSSGPARAPAIVDAQVAMTAEVFADAMVAPDGTGTPDAMLAPDATATAASPPTRRPPAASPPTRQPPAASPPTRQPPAADSLARETALLDRAQRALGAKDAAGALGLCEVHARRHPRGVLREERERIAIEALVALGRVREARVRVAAFDRAFPGSVQSERVHALVRPR